VILKIGDEDRDGFSDHPAPVDDQSVRGTQGESGVFQCQQFIVGDVHRDLRVVFLPRRPASPRSGGAMRRGGLTSATKRGFLDRLTGQRMTVRPHQFGRPRQRRSGTHLAITSRASAR
jgi:hypothetical protein